MKVRFIGAVGTVTGSCTLIEHYGEYFLVDCGAGLNAVASESTPLDFKPQALRSMFLTHAHLDHCGMIPALVAQGFRGRIYCTAATRDLTLNALADSAALGQCQQQNIPPLEQFECPDAHPEFKWGKYLPAATDLTVAFARSSHILGAVSVSFQYSDPNAPKGKATICFSGDVGCNEDENCFQALLAKRHLPDSYPSHLVLESTYWARNRQTESCRFEERMKALERVLQQALDLSQEPQVLIPCFTLHRTQELLADLHCLLTEHLSHEVRDEWASRLRLEEDSGPLVDVAIESSLAWKHTGVYRRELPRSLNTGKRKPLYLNAELARRAGVSEAEAPTFVEQLFSEPTGWSPIEHSQWLRVGKDGSRLNQQSIRIVIAGSGMCQGGRIMEHLREGLSDPGVIVVLMGFQAPDTLGAQLRSRVDDPDASLDFARWQLPNDVKATITDLGRFYSGHADQQSLVKFALHKDAGARYRYEPLRRIFLNHGDQPSREALKSALIDYATENAATSRELGAVELPKRNAGWFDLGRDTWTEEVEPEVDGLETVVAALQRKVQRLERELAELKQKVS